MFIHKHNPLDPVGGRETPESLLLQRRAWLRKMGLLGGGILLGGIGGYAAVKYLYPRTDEVFAAGEVPNARSLLPDVSHPPKRDERFEYHRAETVRVEAAKYTNFYEFSRTKQCWRYVEAFEPLPWSLAISGLVRNELHWDLNELTKTFAADIVERQYRHRCVEKWAMAVPWVGVPLSNLLKATDPLASATHVRFVSFNRPQQAPHQSVGTRFPWPYDEGLTIAEAMNELAFVAIGMYGQPLLKQHGAPIRLVVPWKYGYKSIKSIERIELVDQQPKTFWSTINPKAYPFASNVNPADNYPWSQSFEQMLGTGESHPTQIYNGYGAWVANLYK